MSTAQRDLDKVIADYQRDGAAVVRGLIDPQWIERMRLAIDEMIASPPPMLQEKDGGVQGSFMSRWNDTVQEFSRTSPLVDLAASAMASKSVRFFYDQLFVREPNSHGTTPLHQDLSYWPLTGRQIVSIWVPFDHVSPDNGVVSYVKGSHNWDTLYRGAPFSAGDPVIDQPMPVLEDPERVIAENEVLAWELAPGDVLMHAPTTLHFAQRNSTGDRRREAVAFRYLGDDARWLNRPGHFLGMSYFRECLPPFAFADGDIPRHDELFPLLSSN
ncbi:phytanoyl-CoA dioxygenase family protein [Streptomyces sp. NPDC101776]|uniref:phytanoyl-CoA dioxygenase family protein n=1 Tax=Streptomyces sp. NPDC101776 TaxID=3366146 RepID=UPI003827FEDD